MVVGRLLFYWGGNFSGAMLNFGRVSINISKLHKKHVEATVSYEGMHE